MSAETRPAKGRAPHRRDENARLAVLHAADDLLVERGFGGVTIEGIAARAGVGQASTASSTLSCRSRWGQGTG